MPTGAAAHSDPWIPALPPRASFGVGDDVTEIFPGDNIRQFDSGAARLRPRSIGIRRLSCFELAQQAEFVQIDPLPRPHSWRAA